MKYIICHNMPADKAWAKDPGTQDFSSSQMDDVVLSGGVEVRILRREVDLCFIWTGYGIQRIGSWKFMNCLSRFGKLWAWSMFQFRRNSRETWQNPEQRACFGSRSRHGWGSDFKRSIWKGSKLTKAGRWLFQGFWMVVS